MPAKILYGHPAAEQIQADITQQLKQLGHPPKLIIIQVGQDPASSSYIKRKQKLAATLGIQISLEQYTEITDTKTLITTINNHNQDSRVTGILVQLPLPSPIDTEMVLEAIDPIKDIDGLTPINLGRLMARQPYIVPATARGIIALLDFYKISIEGKLVTIVGRSRLVGQPIAQLLLHRNATVTIAHRKTVDLASATKQADILVVVAGHPNLITPDMVKPGATVVDVGLTKTDQGMQGDVHADVAEIAGALSPVPGGVGPMTVVGLMANIVQAAETQNHHD